MFNIKYLTMHKVHMHAGAIRQLLYGCAYVRGIIYSLKLVDYPPVHTHKPYNYLHLLDRYVFAALFETASHCFCNCMAVSLLFLEL